MSKYYFSGNFMEARSRFSGAAAFAGQPVQTFVNPRGGPNGEEIATDVVRFGAKNARHVLVLISGHHGAEALVGSACQIGWIVNGGPQNLPDDTAVVLVHGINCWGATAVRRNNEDNIDLCRNFMDFSKPLPANESYLEIHDAINCPDIEGPKWRAAEEELADFAARKGNNALMRAFASGQYQKPDGVFYGGQDLAWSSKTLLSVLAEQAENAEQVCIVDLHSGVGPYGYGMAVSMDTGADLERAQKWFGGWIEAPVAEALEGRGDYYAPSGHPSFGYPGVLGTGEVISVVLEFGAYPFDHVMNCLRRDHWLWQYGDPKSALGKTITRDLLEAFCPRNADWREAVWTRAEQVINQALRGLGTQK